ncbi:receptor-like protein kinase 5 [Ipomoea triloba]|uniref:receptor-like protein kinase 5 n=1 Tax=Ipomoea triloba TaxID=35885 RepID=UPI00125D0AB2|nr:receptor-like protein kinase 5 [Ipomoea triloba]XP_031114828.1 receptor-like protein kinase 5 [Ipomoea triloba]XP_031114829.1 receptor-like protein kinase 5 [Ipomoea triloba]XP_031114830.1 receptor-like protein kinase 5 [Ipomoea triloba]XP_031114831.1 receptor-like protein kinase 5 [Ipomoea triloba]XP_031114832.1 receptor-like protein kinase 5 [Ipomoea triloba]XP_031114833.1 receptor-like protein kinase 5 [Ipomoea triloba]
MSISTQINFCILTILIFSFPFYGESQTSSINPERSILLDLKKHFSNPPNISHWKSSSDHCTWPEITCRDGIVTGIQLVWLLISDTIPPFICHLKNLTFLDLNHNYIPGSFPTLLYNCSNLEYLDLSFNNFSGIIPDDISRLSPHLEVFNLSSNWFVGRIPAGISGLKGLKELQLAGVVSNGSFPSEIGNLPNLEVLVLSQNSFTPQEIPPSFTQLKKLRNLSINQANLIGEIPANISNMTALEFLDLSVNNISGSIPVGLGRLPALRDVCLYTNNLSGEIPMVFGQFSKLNTFDVSTNHLTGSLPEGLCSNKVLSSLIVFNNNLTGQLPKSLEDCNTLKGVRVERNNLSGTIPEGLWTARNLNRLLMNNNQFTGQLPQKVASNLSLVDISNNRFSGEIPTGISSWSNLGVFRASNNLFTGNIPQQLTALRFLSTLLLDRNRLSGNFVSNITSWKSLDTLNCSRNQLSGNIPPELGLLPNLVQLDLSENQFSGEIPSEIGRLRLSALNLSSNHLSGKIPEELEVAAFNKSFLNNPNLCADTPSLHLRDCKSNNKSSGEVSVKLIAILGTIGVFLLLVAILYIWYSFRSHRKRKKKRLVPNWKLTAFHTISFTESNILPNLAENNVVGTGGSGIVYVVPIGKSSGENVAVKRIWNSQKLDEKLEKEFIAEVETLGTIRHTNIVKLLCCISSEESKLLVYEYMENHSLDLWLHPKRRSAGNSGSFQRQLILDWPKRIRVAIGTAKGLCYMHHNCSPPIVHRDVKSSNILLDSEFNAKIADFGLARMLNKHGQPNIVSAVAGSFGYIAPEYAHTRKVNQKTDVYSFGVILLELATGRGPTDGDDDRSLADWARYHFQEGNPIEDALDETIKEPKYLDEMRSMFRLGILCAATNPSERPTMREVVHILVHCSNKLLPDRNRISRSKSEASSLLKAFKGGDNGLMPFHEV